MNDYPVKMHQSHERYGARIKKYVSSRIRLPKRCYCSFPQLSITAVFIIAMISSTKLNDSFNRKQNIEINGVCRLEDSRKCKMSPDLNYLSIRKFDLCNSSRPQFFALYSLTKFVSSGCEAWTALVKNKNNNSSGLIKIRHGLGCKRPKNMTLQSLQEWLSKNTTEVKSHISHRKYVSSLFTGLILNGCPGVMQLQDVVCHGSIAIPIWHYCPGKSIHTFVAHNVSDKSMLKIKKISSGIAQTLICMIEKGIWHIDLSSSNVLYDEFNQQTCIIDLERARYMGPEILQSLVPDYTEKILSTIWEDGTARVRFVDPILTLGLHVLHLMRVENLSNGHVFSSDQTIHEIMNLMGNDAFDSYRKKYNLPQLQINDNTIPHQRTPLYRLNGTLRNEDMERFVTNLFSYAYSDRISSLREISRALG